jgi:chromosome partitioning protein
MRKIVVSLSKGGVGKTTTAVNLAAGLAMSGSNVLLVDTDTQGQAGSMIGFKPETGLAELMLGECEPEKAVVEARKNLYLLAGGRTLAGIQRLIVRKEFGGEQTLSEALSVLDGKFDYVIVDTPPGWGAMTINVLFYAEEILAPVSLEVMTLQGLLEFEQSLKAIQEYHQGLVLKYVLPTFLDRRVKKSTEILEMLRGHYGELVCDPIRYNVRLSEAPGFGQTIFEYDANSPGAKDYGKLTKRIARHAKTQKYP